LRTRIESAAGGLARHKIQGSVLQLSGHESDGVFCVGQTKELSGQKVGGVTADVDQNSGHKVVFAGDNAETGLPGADVMIL
jgi:hypothetical protein